MKLTKKLFVSPTFWLLGLAACILSHSDAKAGTAMALMPFMALPARKEDKAGDPAGGGALGEKEFQGRVLSAIGKVQQQTEEISTNLDKTDKEGKQLAEDFQKHCRTFEGLPNQVASVQRSVSLIEAKIANERRSNFGSALDAITRCAEQNDLVCGVIRGIASEKRRTPMTAAQKSAWETYQKAVTEGASPGSTYINDDLVTNIYSLIAEYGIWRGFDVIAAGTKTTKLIVDSTDPDMLVVDEGTAPDEAAYTGASVSAAVKKLLGWIGVSSELLEDSEVNVAALLLPKFANATAKRIDFFALAADGTADATNGGFTGIFAGGTAAVAAATHTSVAATTLEDWLKVLLTVNAAALTRPCKWWMHPQQIVRALAVKDGNGRSIFLPAIDAPTVGGLGSILGYPVVASHAAQSTDGVSKKIAAFGDPLGEAVLLRKDFEWAASDQVKFLEDKTVFRARARVAAKIKQTDAFAVLTTAAA